MITDINYKNKKKQLIHYYDDFCSLMCDACTTYRINAIVSYITNNKRQQVYLYLRSCQAVSGQQPEPAALLDKSYQEFSKLKLFAVNTSCCSANVLRRNAP